MHRFSLPLALILSSATLPAATQVVGVDYSPFGLAWTPSTATVLGSNSTSIGLELGSSGTIGGGGATYTGTFGPNSYNFSDPSLAGPYTAPGYNGQNAFFNQYTGGAQNPHLRMDINVIGDANQVEMDFSGAGLGNLAPSFNILSPGAVEGIDISYTYLGVDGYLSPGWTGLDTPNTNFHRPVLAVRNDSISDGITATLSADGFSNWLSGNPLNPSSIVFDPTLGGSFKVAAPSGWTGANGDAIAPVLSGGNTIATVDLDEDLAAGAQSILWFQHSGDLGDLVRTTNLSIRSQSGTFLDTGRFLLSTDGMAPTIPEPSRGIFLSFGALIFLLRRRRS